jgi:broad specificity phosphatase PhoE
MKIGIDQIVSSPLERARETAEIIAEQPIGAMGAEDPVAFQAWVLEALGDAARREGGVLLVAHAGVGQVIDAARRGIDPAGFTILNAI